MSNRVIVITGASSGIGEQAALQLAGKARLCLIARRRDELEAVQAAVSHLDGQAWIYPTDLTCEEDISRCSEDILAEHGHVDILVNNAGRSICRSVRQSVDRSHDFRRTMEINYHAAVQLTLKLLPSMLVRDSGHIINITSVAVQTGQPGYAAYVASKVALESFSRIMSAELADSGIKTTVIRYPLVRTAMSQATDVYRGVPMMGAAEAAGWIVRAVESHPARIGTMTGNIAEAMHLLMPATTTRWTGRLFRYLGRRQRGAAGRASGS